jgi:hypothetical protein
MHDPLQTYILFLRPGQETKTTRRQEKLHVRGSSFTDILNGQSPYNHFPPEVLEGGK